MNGLERITSRIEAEAKSEVHAIVENGRKEISEAVDGWVQKIEAERKELAERNEKAAAERVDKYAQFKHKHIQTTQNNNYNEED